jgi:hypothetical protein
MHRPSTPIPDYMRSTLQDEPYQCCDAVRICGGFMRCCESYEESIRLHLPQAMPLDIREEINHFTEMNDPNFPRRLNSYLRPVIQNAKIRSPNAIALKIFIIGFPYEVDSSRQFLTLVYAIFNAIV